MSTSSFGESRERPSLARDESFMKGLFGGVVLDGIIFPYPEATRPEADELHPLLDGIRRLAKSVDSARIDREQCIGPDIIAAVKEQGLFGLVVPKAYGGAGLSETAYARMVQELAYVDPSLAVVVSAHQSLGLAALGSFGSEELKTAWLPRLASGEAIAAFALVERAAGSDAASIQTRADRDGDFFVLSGEKIWVTNGAEADVFTVFARTSPAEDGAKPRLTAFLVERASAGITVGADEPKLGVCGARTASLVFDKVRVPATHVLGDIGRGFLVAMEVFTTARLALAATCIGIGKRLVKMSVERATERRAFGRAISEFGLVKDKLAAMSADLFAIESMTYLTTGLVDQGRTDFAVESAISKVFASETLWRIANEALQIGGGLGYMRSHPWERLLRDARHAMVYEGTNEILRAFVALSGMQTPGRELEDVAKAMREPIKGFGLLSEIALRKAKSVLSRERERLTKAHPAFGAQASRFDENTAHLARYVERALRRHGKNIAEMQYTQKRVADVAIDLYAIASCLSRTTRAIEKRGEEGSRREIDLTCLFIAAAEKRITANIAAFDDNDDDLRKSIAQRTCADGGYPLDVI